VPESTVRTARGVYGAFVLPSQSDRVPPSLFLWPGVRYPRLASPPPTGREGVIGHKVPCDTDTTRWHLIH
jgi:hypothetical protein